MCSNALWCLEPRDEMAKALSVSLQRPPGRVSSIQAIDCGSYWQRPLVSGIGRRDHWAMVRQPVSRAGKGACKRSSRTTLFLVCPLLNSSAHHGDTCWLWSAALHSHPALGEAQSLGRNPGLGAHVQKIWVQAQFCR